MVHFTLFCLLPALRDDECNESIWVVFYFRCKFDSKGCNSLKRNYYASVRVVYSNISKLKETIQG